MDARTLSELTQLAAHDRDVAERAFHAAEELYRRLSAAEDAALEEEQRRVAVLSERRRGMKADAS